MSLALSGADVGHLVVAVGLTYALGFERDLRGAPTGDRVFALIGAGSGVVGMIAVHGAPNALAGAITGIGFIGGGLVFRQEIGRKNVVMGITTAHPTRIDSPLQPPVPRRGYGSAMTTLRSMAAI
jgi:uncharacterized membrane protein YhiD involved in acid resistance